MLDLCPTICRQHDPNEHNGLDLNSFRIELVLKVKFLLRHKQSLISSSAAISQGNNSDCLSFSNDLPEIKQQMRCHSRMIARKKKLVGQNQPAE